MKKVILFLCLLIMFGFMPAKAQKVWSLQECITYALENNLQVKRQQLNVQYGKNNYTQSYFSVLPSLNGQFSHNYTSGRTYDYSDSRYEDRNYWSGGIGVGSDVKLFGGFQTINNIMKSKYDYLKSQSDLKKSHNDISLQLALGYLQVLFSKELVDVAKSKLEVTSMQVERTRKMMDVGNVAQGEFLQIKAQEANDKTNLINYQNNLEMAYLELTQLLDLDSTGGFDVVVPGNIEIELLAPLESVQNIFAKAQESMPQIKSAEFALKSSEKQLAIAWSQVSPTVNLSGSLSGSHSQQFVDPLDLNGKYTITEQWHDYLYKQVGFSVAIPIFNQLQVKNSISNAKLSLQDTKLQLDIATMALYKEVQQAHTDATAAREKYYSSVEAVNYNEEAFKYTSQKMEVGIVNSVDYNIAQNNLIAAKSSMLQAKYEYIFKLKILDLYMNKPIVL